MQIESVSSKCNAFTWGLDSSRVIPGEEDGIASSRPMVPKVGRS